MSDRENPEIGAAPARPERKATLRLGQRELSRISLAVILIIVGTGLLAGYRLFKSFKARRDIVIVQTNLRALYQALYAYAQDWDGKLPPAENWRDAVAGYLSAPPNTPGGPLSYLRSPGDDGVNSFAYNELAAGLHLEPTGKEGEKSVDPKSLVLLIEYPGASANAHVRIPPQDNAQAEEALFKTLIFPHFADDTVNATTLYLLANGSILRQTRRDFKQ